MEATEREIVELFSGIPNAEVLETHDKDKPAIYVPGSRKDRVLLVAHYDTVFSKPVKVTQWGTYLVSLKKDVGIGADDRSGVCALWMLRKLGHSLLIVPDEEIGCVGSTYVAEHYADKLKDHQFMIQFDRAGSEDLVYYDTEKQDFEDYLELHYSNYRKAYGSFTDIVQLIPALEIAGVNISIGYYNQHAANEVQNVCEFIQTVYLTMHMLRQKNIPAFKPDPSGYDHGYYGSYFSNQYSNGKLDPWDKEETIEVAPFSGDLTPTRSLTPCELEEADIILCPHCGFEHQDTYTDMYMSDWDQSLCGNCNKFFAPLNHSYIVDEIKDDETNTYQV